MTKTLHGKVHGSTIQLEQDLGVVDGQQVEVHVKIVHTKKGLPGPPPGWRPSQVSSTAGALADSRTLDDYRILEEIYQDRKRETRREVPG